MFWIPTVIIFSISGKMLTRELKGFQVRPYFVNVMLLNARSADVLYDIHVR